MNFHDFQIQTILVWGSEYIDGSVVDLGFKVKNVNDIHISIS